MFAPKTNDKRPAHFASAQEMPYKDGPVKSVNASEFAEANHLSTSNEPALIRTGDPNSELEKTERRLLVQAKIRAGSLEKMSFLYKDVPGSDANGDVSITYTYDRAQNKATEHWHMSNQKIAYSDGVMQIFDMWVDESEPKDSKPTIKEEKGSEGKIPEKKTIKTPSEEKKPKKKTDQKETKTTEKAKETDPDKKKEKEPQKDPVKKKKQKLVAPPCIDESAIPFVDSRDYFTKANGAQAYNLLKQYADFLADDPKNSITVIIYTARDKNTKPGFSLMSYDAKYSEMTGYQLSVARFQRIVEFLQSINPKIKTSQIGPDFQFTQSKIAFGIKTEWC